MKQVTAHGVILAVVLLAAWMTWTSNAPADTGSATIPVWEHDSGDVVAVTHESAERTLLLERRAAQGRSYLWARETTRTMPPASAPGTAADPAQAADAAAVASDPMETPDDDEASDTVQDDADAVADAADAVDAAIDSVAEESDRVTEFPVGDEGDSLVEELARLRAVRDLGEADDDARASYGLADSAATVTVRLRNGPERILALGNTAIGGGDRYVLDVERNRIFAVPVTLIRPLETAQALRLTEYQTFDADDVGRVTVKAGESERTMERHAAGTAGPATWSPPNGDQQDPAFAGFMDQVDRLWVSEFAPDVSAETLDLLVRIDYYGRRGNAIGYLELFRAPGGAESPDTQRYFMRSPQTIVLGEVYGPLGERLEQDLETMFGGGAPAAASASAAGTRPADLGT